MGKVVHFEIPFDDKQRAMKEAPHTVVYVGVDSIDAALKKVATSGGKVVTPRTPIPGMGAFARISDPEGNVVGLFETA
jgi:predicted enzyme related to lactoylglutathione lyase